ncbi:MAG: acetolactate synthase small subunit [Candidatus Aureabacteria bacterium]|nr:acetolactate synthase small subunit [Candidatus Auribacterota bacterium]
MKRIISVLVENKFGVLARISGLFSGRGFNIDSLCVAETQDENFSRMTIVVRGDEMILEQVKKQLNKLINVIKVQDFTDIDYVDRELVLIKVNLSKKSRAELMEIADIFRAKIVDVAKSNITVEITGSENKINAFIELISPFGIIESVRTGKIAIARR